jgi:hypothetical protein
MKVLNRKLTPSRVPKNSTTCSDIVSPMEPFEELSEEDLLMIEGALQFADEALELAELALPAYWEILKSDIF